MSKELITINTEWLSDCSGCHIAIVDLHEKIMAVLESVRIQHCPVLTDIKDYPPAKIGLVSGAHPQRARPPQCPGDAQELRTDHRLGLLCRVRRSGRGR